MNKIDGLFKRTFSKTKHKPVIQFGVPIEALLSSKHLPSRTDPIEIDIPDVLIYLIDYLSNDQFLSQEGIFRIAGSVKTVKEIINDINQKGPQIIAESGNSPLNCVCSILKQWIRDIPEGFVGEVIHQRLNQAKDDQEELINIFKSLPNPRKNMLFYICRFILKIISYESQNKMSRANLAIIFGPNIFKPPEVAGKVEELSYNEVENNFRYIRWLELLLSNFDDIFHDNNNSSNSGEECVSMQEFLRGNVASVILNENEEFVSKKEKINSISLSPENVEPSEKLQSNQMQDQTDYLLEKYDQMPNIQENASARNKRRGIKNEKSEQSHSSDEDAYSEHSQPEKGEETENILEKYDGIRYQDTDDESDDSLVQKDNSNLQKRADPGKFPLKDTRFDNFMNSELGGSRNESLETDMQELFHQLQKEDSLKLNSINSPMNTIHKGDKTEESIYQESSSEKEIPSPFLNEDSPFLTAISRIMHIRESEGRPVTFSSMTKDQMQREKLVIKKELSRLKEYSASHNTITDEDSLMLKRLICWYKELKTRISSFDKNIDETRINSELVTSFKYEKQILKIRLHQFVIDFKKREGRSPNSSHDWSSMSDDYRRYKELRRVLKEE